MDNYEKQAKARVKNTPELYEYSEEIFYDWHEEDHMEWVATAPVPEIISWAKEVRYTDYYSDAEEAEEAE